MSYDKHYSKWKDFLSVGEVEKTTAQEGASISKRQQGAPPRDTDAVVADIVKELAAQPLSEQVRDSKTSQLHEVSADEIHALQPMLDKLAQEGTSVLPFADVFGDKTRLVVPYESDGFTEEGKELEKSLHDMGFRIKADGIIERPITKTIPARVGKDGEEIPSREVESKERYKIGKFLSKLKSVVERYKKVEHVRAELTKKNKQSSEADSKYIDDPHWEEETAEEKQFRQATMDLRKTTGSLHDPHLNAWMTYYTHPAAGIKKIERLQKLWQQRAGDIVGAYKLVVSRSPIDVFRMSDFKNIQSCHSPASIGADDAGGSYWQCAVAEAYGEGAIAYVVADKDLAALTGLERNADASEFEAVIQDGEIFSDKFLASGERGEVGSNKFSGEDLINPVSRIRIRLARWLDHREENPEPVDIMVPEEAVYGGAQGGLAKALDAWVKSVQPDADEKILASAREKGFVWLDAFTFFGGDYSDNSRQGLLKGYLNSIAGKDLEYEGSIRTNADTEEAIRLAGRLEPDYQQRLEMEETLEYYTKASNWGVEYSYVENWSQRYKVIGTMPFTFDNAQDNHNGDLIFSNGAKVEKADWVHEPSAFFAVAKERVQDYVKKASSGEVIIQEVQHPVFEGNQVHVEIVFASADKSTFNEWIYGGIGSFDMEVEKLRKSSELIGYVKRNLMLGGALNGGEFLNYVIDPPKDSKHSVWEREIKIINSDNDGFVELTADIDLASNNFPSFSSKEIMRAASSEDFATALDRAMVEEISRFRDETIPPLGIDVRVYNDGKSAELVMMFDHQSPDSLVDAIVLAESVIFHIDTIVSVIEKASAALLSGGNGAKHLQEAARTVGNWKKFLKG